MEPPRLTAYLAGPDIFFPNSKEREINKKDLLDKQNIKGVYPLDNEINEFDYTLKTAKKIFDSNVQLIEKSQVIVANLTPFRGPSADSGTIAELAYGAARGKLVMGYYEGPVELFTKRTITFYNDAVERNDQGQNIASDGTMIEDFKDTDNLMIRGFIEMSGGEICDSFEECAKKIPLLWEKKMAAIKSN
jgi:nucleoside 2-deoxyribosyltransferase